jgi:hypothetical protein
MPCGLGGKEIPLDHFIDHMPKLPHCPICIEAKMQKKGRYKTKEEDKDPCKEPHSFGDNVTMDNANILNPKQASRHKDKTLCVMLDRWAGWYGAYPAPDRTTETIVQNVQHFAGRRQKVDYMYFDNAREYIDAATQMGISYGTRDANRPQSNGVAERAVRTILEGTRSILFQSGLQHCYWAEAAECFAFSKNIHSLVRNTKETSYFLRFGHKF